MARIALVPLVLLAVLSAVPAAAAAGPTLPPLLAAAVGNEEAEEAQEGGEEEPLVECEEDGPACEEEAEAEASGPPECPLRSAKAHAVLKKNKLKITIGYTTNEPVNATVQLKYGGDNLETFKRRLGQSGVLRFSKPTKQAGKRLSVRIDGGAGCPSRRLVLFPK